MRTQSTQNRCEFKDAVTDRTLSYYVEAALEERALADKWISELRLLK